MKREIITANTIELPGPNALFNIDLKAPFLKKWRKTKYGIFRIKVIFQVIVELGLLKPKTIAQYAHENLDLSITQKEKVILLLGTSQDAALCGSGHTEFIPRTPKGSGMGGFFLPTPFFISPNQGFNLKGAMLGTIGEDQYLLTAMFRTFWREAK
jgi:hypothetical protein